MKVEHDRPSTMEGRGDLYRAGTQPGPLGPCQPPRGLLGALGASCMNVPPRAPRALAGGTGGILHEGGLASSTCVLELRTMYGKDHVILRPTFPACLPSHVIELCNIFIRIFS